MSSSIKSDSSSTTMAAATSRKKKGQELTKKKPMKKSVKQQKKHRAAKQREYEQKRPRGDYRPRIRLAPGSYVILPIVKAEPVVKKEPNISAERTSLWRSQLSSRRSLPSFKRNSPWTIHLAMAGLSEQSGCLCCRCSGYFSSLVLFQVRLQCCTSRTSRSTRT